MASKSRRKKAKFKLTKELVILVVGLLAILVATIILAIPSSEKKFYNKLRDAVTNYGDSNAQLFSSDHVFKEIDEDEYIDVINEVKSTANSGYTYFLYGQLTNSTYVSQLYPINETAKDYGVSHVYLFYSTFYNAAKDNDELNTSSFKEKCNEYESILNNGKSQDAYAIDLTKENALFVFKNGSLIFNSQADEDSKYGWDAYIKQAFSYEQIEKLNN